MDKMLIDGMGDITITNDGVTILKEMDIEHPAAKMMVEVAKTQDDEVGDGTTTAVVIAAELLRNAEDLLAQKVHPTVIAEGYRLATTKALVILDGFAITSKTLRYGDAQKDCRDSSHRARMPKYQKTISVTSS